MNRVILQLWEESNSNGLILSDGCTLHIDSNERNKYVNSIYQNRNDEVPDKYDRIVGSGDFVFIDDDLFNLISTEKTIKLTQNALKNLINFEEIVLE